jgi:hypothetical protein
MLPIAPQSPSASTSSLTSSSVPQKARDRLGLGFDDDAPFAPYRDDPERGPDPEPEQEPEQILRQQQMMMEGAASAISMHSTVTAHEDAVFQTKTCISTHSQEV